MRFGRRTQAWQSAGDGLLRNLLTAGGAAPESLVGAEGELGVGLPEGLASLALTADAAEGWVGSRYLAIWPIDELAELNRRGRIADWAPGLVAFATNGGGEGYFFDRVTGGFVNGPMIGLGYIDSVNAGTTFAEFLDWLATGAETHMTPAADSSRFGLVIHEIKPILFGGDPTDAANKVYLPLAEYLDVVAWWNDRLQQQLRGGVGSG